MIINGVQIAVTRAWIEDVLRMRIEVNLLKIEDLFMVTRAPSETLEGDSFIETKYGKLRVFWRNDMPENKLAQILHTAKYKYPQKNNKLELANVTTDVPHQKIDAPKLVAPVSHISREFNDEVKKVAAQVSDELDREGFNKNSGYDQNGDLVN